MAALNKKNTVALTLEGKCYTKAALTELCRNVTAETPSWKKEFLDFLVKWLDDRPVIKIYTSGTTGRPKQMMVKKKHMVNSAKMTGRVLSLQPGDQTLLCLPVRYVAGMMMIVRAFVLGLNLVIREPAANPSRYLRSPFDFAAMTPMQVVEVFQGMEGRKKLENIRKLLIGGASIPSQTEQKLKLLSTRIWHTYGMTETLTHIALRRVTGSNATTWFTPLPEITVRQGAGNVLVVHASGISNHPVITRDVAAFDEQGRFRILGRRDHVINSGGLKCHPESIENVLGKAFFEPYFVAGWPDEKLGEKIILFVQQLAQEPGLENRIKALFVRLPDQRMRPRKLCFVPGFLRTGTGKLRRKDTLNHYLKHKEEILAWKEL